MSLLCNVVSPPLLPPLVDREAFIVYSQVKRKTLKQKCTENSSLNKKNKLSWEN